MRGYNSVFLHCLLLLDCVNVILDRLMHGARKELGMCREAVEGHWHTACDGPGWKHAARHGPSPVLFCYSKSMLIFVKDVER